ncbi:TPA-induced transmembrane protein homolog [Antennarius striatus]|uniref:TPA-induced transmembrane protein homolog n=1 Tax=Antennarius striatus TaxID=241820 RepID=UPI0035B0AB11
MDVELEAISTNKNNGSAFQSNEQVTAGNGDGLAYRIPGATEKELLLHVQSTDHNGEKMPVSHSADKHRSTGNTYTSPEIGSVCTIKKTLNDIVFWKVRIWMVIIFIFLLIVAVVIVTLLICAAIHEDTENFDPSLFKIPLFFDGSFQMPNMVFSEEFFVLSSNQSQTLADICQEKLSDLYRSSPALGRYFSKAEIYAFRNGSVIVDYQLTFLMPEDQQDQLRNFTLSREMVFNVFRQFLYDQDTDESEPMFIDPGSLNMFLTQQ